MLRAALFRKQGYRLEIWRASTNACAVGVGYARIRRLSARTSSRRDRREQADDVRTNNRQIKFLLFHFGSYGRTIVVEPESAALSLLDCSARYGMLSPSARESLDHLRTAAVSTRASLPRSECARHLL